MTDLRFNPCLGQLPVYQPGRPIEEVARELNIPAADIIKLASNENPLGPSPLALEAMQTEHEADRTTSLMMAAAEARACIAMGDAMRRLGEVVRWEPSRGGQLFPHIYGELPMDAVVAVAAVERSADGAVKLPGPE